MTDFQRDYWNEAAARWVPEQDRIDALLAPITEALLVAGAPAPGERVLDVGCGAGSFELILRDRVGPTGTVTGLDIAGTMIAAAQERATGTAIRFVEADASTYAFEPAFDLVISRFGVMFFVDPVAALANVRRAIAPGGRLAFVCWRGVEVNPWANVPLAAARPVLPPQDPPVPNAPGPFAFGDGDRLRGILDAAGYRDVVVAPTDGVMVTGTTPEEAADTALAVGPISRITTQLDSVARAEVHARITEAMRAHVVDGRVVLATAVWSVTGR